MSDFNEQRIVTARKVHNCEFCKKQIQPGERYSYESGAFEGDFYTRKLCPECFDMLDTCIAMIAHQKKIAIHFHSNVV